jgi:hypothetical protein
MSKYEEIAEKVILLAYNQGGSVCDEDVKKILSDSEYEIYWSEDSITSKILRKYGEFINPSLSECNYTYYLNDAGSEFARTGCYSGEESREREKAKKERRGIAIGIITIIIAILTLIFSFVS